MKIRHIDDDLKRVLSSIPPEIGIDEKKWIESRLHDEAILLSSQLGMENFWKVMRFCHFVATTKSPPKLDKAARQTLLKKADDARRIAVDLMRQKPKFRPAVDLIEEYAKECDEKARVFDPFSTFPYMAVFGLGRGDRIDARRAYFVASLTDAFVETFKGPRYDWTAILFGVTFGDDGIVITPRRIEGIYRRAFGMAPKRPGGEKTFVELKSRDPSLRRRIIAMVEYGLELKAKD